MLLRELYLSAIAFYQLIVNNKLGISRNEPEMSIRLDINYTTAFLLDILDVLDVLDFLFSRGRKS